jgi:general secretion pathway protein C
MSSRLTSLLIWAAVAASVVYWALQLSVRATPVPGGAQVANAAPPPAGNLARLLGAVPVQAVVQEAAVPTDARFRLLGVVAPRPGGSGGLALISIDGKPARAVSVGREVEPGLRLLTVNHRQAELGAARGTPGMVLALPPLAEANRGRPGEAPVPGAPAMPGMPGMPAPGMLPGVMQPGGLPPVPVQPGGPAPQPGDQAAVDASGLQTR